MSAIEETKEKDINMECYELFLINPTTFENNRDFNVYCETVDRISELIKLETKTTNKFDNYNLEELLNINSVNNDEVDTYLNTRNKLFIHHCKLKILDAYHKIKGTTNFDNYNLKKLADVNLATLNTKDFDAYCETINRLNLWLKNLIEKDDIAKKFSKYNLKQFTAIDINTLNKNEREAYAKVEKKFGVNYCRINIINNRKHQKARAMIERIENIESDMIENVINEIIDKSPSVGWEDIAGLEHAKKTLKYMVTLPLKRPELFNGIRQPDKGLLLFGPPGTGKTMIGKCIASSANSTFFNISSSSLTSKFVGDGEKMVRALFAVARCYQPAVIFIDEIDSLLAQRTEGESESSRRIKTEFLVQFDGAGTTDSDQLLVIGATNRPQELDEAVRRRFRKRLYIPLPDLAGRKTIIHRLLKKIENNLSEKDIENIAKKTDGYSGSDMNGLCREAALEPIRSADNIMDIKVKDIRPISLQDFEKAMNQVRSSVNKKDLEVYTDWVERYGSLDKTSNK